MQIVAPSRRAESRVSGMTFDEIRFRGEGGNARSRCAATFTVFPRGFPLVTPIVIRAREGEDNAGLYTCRHGSPSSSSSASESADFAPKGLIEKTAATACRMTPSQFYNRANEREPRIASLNFSQAFMAKKSEENKIDFLYIDKYII